MEFHFKELGYRLIYYTITLFLAFVTSFYYSQEIFFVLTNTFEVSFVFTQPFEPLFLYFNTSIIIALFFSLICLVFHVYLFLSTGLKFKEKSLLIRILILSNISMIILILFFYFFVLPYFIKFLFSFEIYGLLNYLPRLQDYYYFILVYLLLIYIFSQIPIFIYGLFLFKLISLEELEKLRPFYLLLCSLIAMMFSTPEIISIVSLLFIFYISFEIFIFIIILIKKYEK